VAEAEQSLQWHNSWRRWLSLSGFVSCRYCSWAHLRWFTTADDLYHVGFVLGLVLDADGCIAAGVVGKGPGSNGAGARVSGSHAATVPHNLNRVLVSYDCSHRSYLDEAANVIKMVSCTARRLRVWASHSYACTAASLHSNGCVRDWGIGPLRFAGRSCEISTRLNRQYSGHAWSHG
jgi:hypothetical protein